MKEYYLYSAFLVLLFFTLFSCTNENNLDPEGNWTLSSAVATQPSNNDTVILNETNPDSTITFTWTAAVSSSNFGISYSVVIDTLGSTLFSNPILTIQSGNAGKNLNLGITASVINQALSMAGYPANAVSKLTWAVKASCLTKTSYGTNTLSIKRFIHELLPSSLYLSGTSTETGTNLSKAILMKRLTGSDGVTLSNKFEVYTSLIKGKSYKFYSAPGLPALQYGGLSGKIIKAGSAITATDSGEFRISVNLDSSTYNLKKISYFSVVGDIITNGWSGDDPLVYQGGGIWQKSITLVDTGGFVFRANGDWGFLLKLVNNTQATLAMEADAPSEGLTVGNIHSVSAGQKIVTLNLSATGYTYTIVPDPNAIITIPSSLYLLQGSTTVCQFNKTGNVFTSPGYLPLQGSVSYTLNSAADGSGLNYPLSASIGATSTLGGDQVTGTSNISQSIGSVSVQYDQAYSITIDFSTTLCTWQYYNMKLFQWSDTGWNSRNEFVMTYVHPLTYTVTEMLVAGDNLKFNSPWDIQFSPDIAGLLNGTMTNISSGGPNFQCITASGNYQATIVVNSSFQTGTYSFVSQ